MDAMLEEKLDLDSFWRTYVGETTPLEFMNRGTSPDIAACVEAYVAGLPVLYGIVRRRAWKDTFEAPWQYRRGEVAAALQAKLEATETEWRPHLNQRPPVAPHPLVGQEVTELDEGRVAHPDTRQPDPVAQAHVSNERIMQDLSPACGAPGAVEDNQ